MRTVVSDPPPAEFQELLERRRRWGADRHDEIWEGVYRMIPSRGKAHWPIERSRLIPLGPADLAGRID